MKTTLFSTSPNRIKQKLSKVAAALLFAACFALSPAAQAVSPPPDGGYPGFNTAEGQNALFSLTTGSANTAVGWFSLWSNAAGSFNTATGAGALLFNNGDPNAGEASQNSAFGSVALLFNTTGSSNTAVGAAALLNNTIGGGNTATGAAALSSNSEGSENTATGAGALVSNTTGSDNTANGHAALFNNTTGTGNTASGFAALLFNNGNFNTAVGPSALFSNVFGDSNTAIGYNALYNNNGPANAALGAGAGYNATTGSGNVYIGAGMVGVAGESNACYIASIFGQTSVTGVQVFINSDNKLGTVTSSKRFKEEIKPMDKASEALFALKPVTFHYKKEIDPAGRSQFGLVAEEVAEVNPDLVVHDKDGKPYTVRYDAVNAMLLNEFLKQHKEVEEQQVAIAEQRKDFRATECKVADQESTIAHLEATIAQQRADFETTTDQQHKQIEALTASVKEQATQLERVSAHMELNRPAGQQVALTIP